MIHSNIIYSKGIAYKIINIIPVHQFLNKNGSINQKVLGMYVHENNCDHVLQKQDKFLICETIEEATIV